MSRSYTRPPATTTTTTTTSTSSSSTPRQPPPALKPRCNHNHLATRLTSHSTANPDRVFYQCYKERNDPERCKYFKWEDQLLGETYQSPPSTSAARMIANLGGQTLGATPSTRQLTTPTRSKPISSIRPPSRPSTQTKTTEDDDATEDEEEIEDEPFLGRQKQPSDEEQDSIDDGFDWENMDIDAVLEAASSQERTSESGKGSDKMLGKLKAVVVKEEVEEDVKPKIELEGKRKRFEEEIEPRTPKKVQWERTNDDHENPFLAKPVAPPTPVTPPHLSSTSIIDPAISSVLSPVASHLAKLEQKLKAAEKQKFAYRERIKALEGRVMELEGVLNARGR